MRVEVLIVFSVTLVLMGCLPDFDERPALPTAIPGILSHGGDPKTLARREINAKSAQGPTSTPAPWATPLPPPPLPKARPVSHNLTGKADCLYCHRGPTYYRMPADHATRTNQTCLGCHSTSTGPPPPVPHTTVGREGCLICHLRGTKGARAVPGDHGGRLNDSCGACHSIK